MRDKLLKITLSVLLIIFLLSGMCLDSASFIPYIVCGVDLVCLLAFTIANKSKIESLV